VFSCGRKEGKDKVYIYDTNLIYLSMLHTSVSMLAIAVRSGCSDLNSVIILLNFFLYTVVVLPRKKIFALRYSVISYHIRKHFARLFYPLN
jgi:hypothetical protein